MTFTFTTHRSAQAINLTTISKAKSLHIAAYGYSNSAVSNNRAANMAGFMAG
jgi:hypothetical protein